MTGQQAPDQTMDTANGRLHVGQRVRVVERPANAGRRAFTGTITHLYTRGVMAGLVVVDDRHAVEGVNVHPA